MAAPRAASLGHRLNTKHSKNANIRPSGRTLQGTKMKTALFTDDPLARGHFPNDDAATKLLNLILNRSEKEWKMPPREWSMAKAQFAVIFGERFIRAMAA